MTRMTANGYPIIQVRGIAQLDTDDRTWSYAWAGTPLSVGDEFIVNIDGREWEVVVVAHGTDYTGYIRIIGGDQGLGYRIENGYF